VAHLAWKKGVCRRGAAFHITFQHKTTFSLNPSSPVGPIFPENIWKVCKAIPCQ